LSQVLEYKAELAEAGEFSKRAFLNGKIDLVQAEAIADLIDASSQQAVKSAVKSLQGDFSKRINTLVKALVDLRVFVESTLDFSDEELDFIATDEVSSRIKKIAFSIQEILTQATQGRLLQNGINVIIAGKPNAGKSSLFNALTQEDSAIVTDIAGTTRDIIKEKITLDGVPVYLFDTAGLRYSEDKVEKVGITRAKLAIKEADIVLLVYDGREKPDLSLVAENKNILLVKNKTDLITSQNKNSVLESEVLISAKNNIGIDNLKQKLKALTKIQTLDDNVILARKRHIIALESALEYINIALNQDSIELLAQDLRATQEQLGQITGQVTSDDLLGEIFSSFCIGK
jgi:tRNA modification GTPase